MIGIDTTFMIDLLNGDSEATAKSLEIENDVLVTTQINVYEVLTGLYMAKASVKAFDSFYGSLDKLTLLNLDSNSTRLAAKLFGEGIRKGERVEQNDCMIAAILKSRGCSKIATRNLRDFKKLGMDIIEY
jgi:hypothetical protein